ncbi:GIP, partial [Symbiodinium microadriaticum]
NGQWAPIGEVSSTRASFLGGFFTRQTGTAKEEGILAETNKMLKTLTAQSQSSQPSSANVDPLVLIQQQLDEVRRFKTMKDVGLPSVCVRGYREEQEIPQTREGVQHPIHGKLKVRIVGHCPVIPVSQALGLIAELEQARMREFEKTVEDLQSQFTGLRGAGRDQWTWQRHLEALREDGERASMAGFLHRCPSFAMNVASGKCCWVKSMPWSRSKRKALFQSDGWIVNFLFFSKVACRVNGRSGGNLDLWQHLSGGPKWTVIAHMVGQHRKLEEVLNVNAAVEKFFEAEEGEVADERLDAAQWLICVVLLKVKLFVERWVEAIHKEADVLFKGVFTVTPPDVEALADNAGQPLPTGLEGLTFDILGPEIGRTEVTKSYGTPCPQATNAAQLAYMARHHLRESVQVKEITFEHIAGLYRLGDLGTKVISTGPVIAKLNGALPVLARLMVVMGWLIQNARASTTDGAGIEALIWSCEWLSVRRCGHCFPFYTVGCVYKELSPRNVDERTLASDDRLVAHDMKKKISEVEATWSAGW